jgi:23S rRNA pseudouridine955/2504/2580 synthase/23S rRNA pseudouridine1911/1915/1917 synthase
MKSTVEIVYQDSDLVVVNKPPNYLSIPDRYAAQLPNVLGFLRTKFEEVFTVHRIDKPTSGIMCFALNAEAHKHLSNQFQERTVQKIYLALVDGKPLKKEGIIDKPIAQNQMNKARMVIAERGKISVTHYKVIEEFRDYALVEADIKTGRTHQIRVHFESMGHPLAVDELYGKREQIYLSEIKNRFKIGKYQTERPIMSRTTLHANKLQLIQPSTGEVLHFEAPLHKDFDAIVKQLQKWGK